MNKHVIDVIVIGAGAAGLMTAIESGRRGRKTIILDHANKVGKKILMSGGGRCNFTNYYTSAENYISHNEHFCKSALSRYTQWDFIELVKKHRIPFHEKTLGQLFCDNKSKDIVNMLVKECEMVNVPIFLNTEINTVMQEDNGLYALKTSRGIYQCQSLVVATGGLSIPTMGASPFAYKLAEQFNIKVWPTRAGLVPLTLDVEDKQKISKLSGISTDGHAQTKNTAFRENILFTHRGLSGPAILQISSYWTPGQSIDLNLLPDMDLYNELCAAREQSVHKKVYTFLTQMLPKRLIEEFIPKNLSEQYIPDCSNKDFETIKTLIQAFNIKPNGTEGYRTAEVTLGGIDCDVISSKTMEHHLHKGLFFIGEALDVTGWLGGYNFQWAWSSGWAAGQAV